MIKVVLPSQVFKKANESLTYYKYDNGYMVECNGRDKNDDYKYLKIVAATIDDVVAIIKDFDNLPKDD